MLLWHVHRLQQVHQQQIMLTIANSAANNAANNDQKNWTFFQDKNGNWFRGNSATGAMTPVNGAPQGGTTIPHPQPTPSGKTITTEVKSPA